MKVTRRGKKWEKKTIQLKMELRKKVSRHLSVKRCTSNTTQVKKKEWRTSPRGKQKLLQKGKK